MQRLLLSTAIAALLTGGGAQAATKTAQFAVRAQVNADCQLTARDLDFGTYSGANNSRVNTTMDLKCTPGSAVTISLDGGGTGNPQARAMTGQGANLGYQLYKDNAYSQPIDTNGAAFQLSNQENTGQTVTYTLYGQVPSGQNVPAGNYTDTVRVTASY